MGKVLLYCCFESYICFCSAVRITLGEPNKQCLIALYCILWNVSFMVTEVSLMFTKARHITLSELVESGPHLDSLYSQNPTSELLNAL